MGVIHRTVIEWSSYQPGPDMQAAIDELNQFSMSELIKFLPGPATHRGKRATLGYRIFCRQDMDEAEKVYVLINGFGERADTIDAGVKGLLVDLLVKRFEGQKYAIMIVGGLFSFPARERNKLLKQGSGALQVIAAEVAALVKLRFKAVRSITVSGYSLGGTMAPLVARAVIEQHVAKVEQVCSGEPNYVERATTRVDLLKRVAKASVYRNEQIRATSIDSYIEVKKTPGSAIAMASYRAKLYRPLVRRFASMRLVACDLALQANEYPAASKDIQLDEALIYLTQKEVKINLLHAVHSVLCHGAAFHQLTNRLKAVPNVNLQIIIVEGDQADHGIEEQRSLSTPFLVKAELYRSA